MSSFSPARDQVPPVVIEGPSTSRQDCAFLSTSGMHDQNADQEPCNSFYRCILLKRSIEFMETVWLPGIHDEIRNWKGFRHRLVIPPPSMSTGDDDEIEYVVILYFSGINNLRCWSSSLERQYWVNLAKENNVYVGQIEDHGGLLTQQQSDTAAEAAASNDNLQSPHGLQRRLSFATSPWAPTKIELQHATSTTPTTTPPAKYKLFLVIWMAVYISNLTNTLAGDKASMMAVGISFGAATFIELCHSMPVIVFALAPTLMALPFMSYWMKLKRPPPETMNPLCRLLDQGLEVFSAPAKEKPSTELTRRIDRLEGRVDRLKKVNHELLLLLNSRTDAIIEVLHKTVYEPHHHAHRGGRNSGHSRHHTDSSRRGSSSSISKTAINDRDHDIDLEAQLSAEGLLAAEGLSSTHCNGGDVEDDEALPLLPISASLQLPTLHRSISTCDAPDEATVTDPALIKAREYREELRRERYLKTNRDAGLKTNETGDVDSETNHGGKRRSSTSAATLHEQSSSSANRNIRAGTATTTSVTTAAATGGTTTTTDRKSSSSISRKNSMLVTGIRALGTNASLLLNAASITIAGTGARSRGNTVDSEHSSRVTDAVAAPATVIEVVEAATGGGGGGVSGGENRGRYEAKTAMIDGTSKTARTQAESPLEVQVSAPVLTLQQPPPVYPHGDTDSNRNGGNYVMTSLLQQQQHQQSSRQHLFSASSAGGTAIAASVVSKPTFYSPPSDDGDGESRSVATGTFSAYTHQDSRDSTRDSIVTRDSTGDDCTGPTTPAAVDEKEDEDEYKTGDDGNIYPTTSCALPPPPPAPLARGAAGYGRSSPGGNIRVQQRQPKYEDHYHHHHNDTTTNNTNSSMGDLSLRIPSLDALLSKSQSVESLFDLENQAEARTSAAAAAASAAGSNNASPRAYRVDASMGNESNCDSAPRLHNISTAAAGGAGGGASGNHGSPVHTHPRGSLTSVVEVMMPPEPLTMVVTHWVKWEHTLDFEKWLTEMFTTMVKFPGFLGQNTTPPVNEGDPYVNAFTFDSYENLLRFMMSPERRRLMVKLEPLLEATSSAQISRERIVHDAFGELFVATGGLLPSRPPPQWKITILTTISLQLIVWPISGSLLPILENIGVDIYLALMVCSFINVFTNVYVGLPLMQMLFGAWLRIPRPSPSDMKPYLWQLLDCGLPHWWQRLTLLSVYYGTLIGCGVARIYHKCC